jgi:hypothetical protein
VIASIDKSDAAKDTITVSTTLGKAIKVGDVAFESAGANTTLKVAPLTVAGSNYDVDPDGDNLWTDAWLIGTVREANAPAVTDAIKTALKGIVYF